MNFKSWNILRELAHLANRIKDEYIPFEIGGKKAILIDMKFETYPDIELRNKLTLRDASFYGKIPGENNYLYFNGHEVKVIPINHVPATAIKLPDYWWDHAEVHYETGDIKPSRITSQI